MDVNHSRSLPEPGGQVFTACSYLRPLFSAPAGSGYTLPASLTHEACLSPKYLLLFPQTEQNNFCAALIFNAFPVSTGFHLLNYPSPMYRFSSLLLLCFLLTQSAFAQKSSSPTPKAVTGTILLDTKKMPDAKTLLTALRNDWKLRTDSSSTADKTIVFNHAGLTVMLAYLDYPANRDELAAAARLSWLWKTAAADVARHQAQVVVTVLGTDNRTLDLFSTLTKTLAAALQNSGSIGVFMNSQYLLLPKDFYLVSSRALLKDKALPVYCWVYFGMMEEGTVSSGYTYGLREFGLEEMEIVKATGSAAETHAVLLDAATSVIQYHMKLQSGVPFTTLEGTKITPTKGKAAFVDGDTFQLTF